MHDSEFRPIITAYGLYAYCDNDLFCSSDSSSNQITACCLHTKNSLSATSAGRVALGVGNGKFETLREGETSIFLASPRPRGGGTPDFK